MTKPLPAGQVSSITLGDCSAAVQETGAQGVECGPDPSAQHRCGSEVGSAVPPRGACDLVPGCTALTLGPRPGQPRALVTERTFDCTAHAQLSLSFCLRTFQSGYCPAVLRESRTGDVQFTASQSSQCAGWEGSAPGGRFKRPYKEAGCQL